MLGTQVHDEMESLIKKRKRENLMGKTLPKERVEKIRCMDGLSSQDPPMSTYIKYIQKRSMRRTKPHKRKKSPIKEKKKRDKVVPSTQIKSVN